MLRKYRIQLIFSAVGMIIGYLVIHPYAMVVYALLHFHQNESFHFHWQDLSADALSSFHPMMLPMALAFAFLGGIIGLLSGILVDRKKKLYAAQHENDKKKVALETIENLMVTLSHHLLNANTIIGGAVRQCRRLEPGQDTLTSLAIIEEQGRKIDTAIKALGKITEIKTADYTSNGGIQIIDIAKELEEELDKVTDKER
jgi:predicted histidine transporter YuiF (NhaC family)